MSLAPLNAALQAEDELRQIQRKMQTLENDYDDTSEKLLVANNNLVEKDKALSNVSPGLEAGGGSWLHAPLSELEAGIAVGGLHGVGWTRRPLE